MSTIGYFLALPDGTIAALLADPPSVHPLVERASADAPDDLVDVDKAWHCLHFLLTGTAWESDGPLGFVVGGGTAIGDEDVGYGPARAFRSPEVAEISDALRTVDAAQLAARFDAERMVELEIYPGGQPGGWDDVDPWSEDSFGYFTDAFEKVKALVVRATKSRRGMLVWLS